MDDFICISCWKEFSTPHDTVQANQGKVECPNCGHVFQVDLSDGDDGVMSGKGKTPSIDTATDSASSQVMDWSDIDMNDPDADEKTPVDPVTPPTEFQESPQADFDLEEEEVIEWRLRTKSGLTFRFSDPEALLGWKKKMSVYKEMQVSRDGQVWVDYLVFVEYYVSFGDAHKAFRVATGETSEAQEASAPQAPTSTRPEPVEPAPPKNFTRRPTEEFTFRTADTSETVWGRYLLYVILGIVMGSGAVWLAWSFLF